MKSAKGEKFVMSDRTYVLSYDIGTTGVKTCLFEVEDEIKLIAAEMEGYSLTVYPDGGAEQDPDEWWSAICNTTKRLMNSTSVSTSEIAGISFCSQMQGLVLVDKDGQPVRKAMSYMDQRAKKQIKDSWLTVRRSRELIFRSFSSLCR